MEQLNFRLKELEGGFDTPDMCTWLSRKIPILENRFGSCRCEYDHNQEKGYYMMFLFDVKLDGKYDTGDLEPEKILEKELDGEVDGQEKRDYGKEDE